MKPLRTRIPPARGQGMAEFMVIVALVLLGALGMYFFGRTTPSQPAAIAQGQTVETTAAPNDASKAGEQAGAAVNAVDTQKVLQKGGRDSEVR
jgi:hypothetical protein